MNSSPHNKCLLSLVLLVWAGFQHVEAQTGFVTQVGSPRLLNSASERGILELTFLIEDGFHIQPAIVGNDNFIPTLLTVGQAGGISFGTPVFPVPDSIFGGFYGYWGTIKVLVPLEVNQGTVSGQYNVAFTFTYQACKDKSCFFPRILNFNVRLGIEKDSITLYVGDGQPTDRQPPG